MLGQNLKAQKISFTLDISQAVRASDIIFIAIGTPQDSDGSADLNSVLQTADSIAEVMNEHKLVIIKSTVPPGTFKIVKQRMAAILQKRNIRCDFDVASNPEFLREGSAIGDFLKPDRIVVGVETEKAQAILTGLYRPLLKEGHGLVVMSPASSEMTKYAANSMLAAKVSLMNELSRICEVTGADIESVREGLGTDHRIGPHFLYAGIGYGGSCLAKDISALVKMGEELGVSLQLLKSAQAINQSQRTRFFEKIKEFYKGQLTGKKIALWGLAFKPGTDDIRDAPALDIIKSLLAAGAKVQAFDPVAMRNAQNSLGDLPGLKFFATQYEALEQADCLVIMTEWTPFLEPDFAQIKSLLKTPTVFDGRNIYSQKNMRDLGFSYTSVGRS
jgi:UDPglucose 6-dehydrogenase